MKIKRMFTMEGEGPYRSIEFENRTSVIRNPDGSIVSEWDNVSVPKQWSQVATDIMAQKYFRKAGIPKYLKSAKEKGIPAWLQPSLHDQARAEQEATETDSSAENHTISETDAREVFHRLAVAGLIGVTSTVILIQKKTPVPFMMNYVTCWSIKWQHQILLNGSILVSIGLMV